MVEEVPVVDMSLNDDEALASELVRAFSTMGFATIVNHGIPLSTVTSAFTESQAFFDLPLHVKNQYKYQGHASNRGFIQMGQETHERASTGAPDRKETFDIGKEGEEGFETPWPKELSWVFSLSTCSEQ